MTLAEALTQISSITGFRTDIATRAIVQLARAQEFFEKGPDYPWFLLSEESLIVTTVGENRLPVPTDFIAEYEEGALYYAPTDEDQIPLEKEDLDYLKEFYGTTTEGVPESYSQDGTYFRIFPLPDDLYPIKMSYYQKATAISGLSTGDTNAWLTHAPDCIIGRAGKILAAGLRDIVAMDLFKEMESEGRVLLKVQNEEKKHSNRTYQVGGPV